MKFKYIYIYIYAYIIHDLYSQGCTVHLVDLGVDSGPIVVQKRCPVVPGETPESLKAKVQALEGDAFIEAIKLYQRERRFPLK